MERALRQAKSFGGPVLVHAITMKGKGYPPAIADEADQFHAVGVIDPETGVPGVAARGRSWTSEFADELVRIGQPPRRRRRDHRGDDDPHRPAPLRRRVPVPRLRRRHRRAARGHQRGRPGLHRPAPGRGGLRHVPQPRLRPGAHGRRAAPRRRHLRPRPGRRHRPGRRQPPRHVGPVGAAGGARACGVAAPRDAARLVEELGEAVDVDDAPTVLRIARDSVPDDIPALERVGGVDVLRARRRQPTCSSSRSARWPPWRSTSPSGLRRRASRPPSSTRAGCCRSTPPCSSSAGAPARGDASRTACGSAASARAWRRSCATTAIDVPLHDVGIPCAFHDHGSRQEVLDGHRAHRADGGARRRRPGWRGSTTGRGKRARMRADDRRVRRPCGSDVRQGRGGAVGDGRSARARAPTSSAVTSSGRGRPSLEVVGGRPRGLRRRPGRSAPGRTSRASAWARPRRACPTRPSAARWLRRTCVVSSVGTSTPPTGRSTSWLSVTADGRRVPWESRRSRSTSSRPIVEACATRPGHQTRTGTPPVRTSDGGRGTTSSGSSSSAEQADAALQRAAHRPVQRPPRAGVRRVAGRAGRAAAPSRAAPRTASSPSAAARACSRRVRESRRWARGPVPVPAARDSSSQVRCAGRAPSTTTPSSVGSRSTSSSTLTASTARRRRTWRRLAGCGRGRHPATVRGAGAAGPDHAARGDPDG